MTVVVQLCGAARIRLRTSGKLRRGDFSEWNVSLLGQVEEGQEEGVRESSTKLLSESSSGRGTDEDSIYF